MYKKVLRIISLLGFKLKANIAQTLGLDNGESASKITTGQVNGNCIEVGTIGNNHRYFNY